MHRLNRFFGNVQQGSFGQHLAVLRGEEFSFLGWEEIKVRFPQKVLASDA